MGEAPCVARARAYASGLSTLYFGCPVYLVGGALTDPDPRDVDIVVPVPNALFLAAYGDPCDTVKMWEDGHYQAQPPAIWKRWARDCAKQNAELTAFCRRTVDFKTQPEAVFAAFDGQPRRRLDCGLLERAALPPLTCRED